MALDTQKRVELALFFPLFAYVVVNHDVDRTMLQGSFTPLSTV